MSEVENFNKEVKNNIYNIEKDNYIKDLSKEWMIKTHYLKYDYNFTWLGRPIIQMPQDIIALQEIIWRVKPDIIIETGIAHGGSLILYSSMLELIGNNGKVIGVDIDIREHNRKEIENHPLYKNIIMIEGSSTKQETLNQVSSIIKNQDVVLLALDSDHTEDHVLSELKLYSPLVKKDSYIIVFDTIIDDFPEDACPDRDWGKNNNPKTAVMKFLKINDRFIIDKGIETKLLLSVANSGYLKCIKN